MQREQIKPATRSWLLKNAAAGMKMDEHKTGTAKSKASHQVRVRLPKGLAQKLSKLPPVVRGEVVGIMLNASAQKIDLESLVGLRQELKNLSLNLTCTLRASAGKNFDEAACQKAIELLERLVKR